MARPAVIVRIEALLHSQQGHNAVVFFVFLIVSTILWMVLAFNEEEQCDVRLPVRLTHVPDSVTVISPLPEAISVSAVARGTQLLKLSYGNPPQVDIDFRAFRQRDAIRLSTTDLKAIARAAIGGATVMIVSPDTLNLAYTSKPGLLMPISVDYKVTPGPQATITGRPKLSADSASIYSLRRLPDNVESISTEPIRLDGLNESVTQRVKLVSLSNSRVIPDSVDVTFEVERLILKTRRVVIEPTHVPSDCKLITFPAQIDVFYMVPMSSYKNSVPHFRVIADYQTLDLDNGSHNIKLRLVDVPDNLHNVHLSADSAEYIIERL